MSDIPFARTQPEKPERNFSMGAFDFETNALDGDVVFGTFQFELDGPGSMRSKIQDVFTPEDMLDGLLRANEPGMRWYAHNLEYDLLYLLVAARELQLSGEIYDIQLFERGLGQFFKCIIHYGDGQTLELYDSMALFGFSLEIFAQNFSKIGQKLKIEWETETFDINNPHHIDYARQDTAILLDSMINLDSAIYDIFGVHVRGTFSSTSLRAYQNFMPENNVYFRLTETQETFCRAGYYGGICFMTDTNEKTNVESNDINSMYPHCMRNYGVPAGRPYASKKLAPGKIGLYKIRANAPDPLKFGCLGYRDKHGICWPRGEFETTAFSFEIERALKWGYKIEILDGLVWPRVDFIFDEFVTVCESKRAEYKNSAFEIVVKLIQNSLYGKFGTKIDGVEVTIFPPDVEIDHTKWRPYVNPDSGVPIIENCYEQDTERDANYMQPHWAAYITARARGVLLDAFELAPDKIYYGDTDSIKIDSATADYLRESGALINGGRYGDFKIDGFYKKFRAIAPKVYVYEDAKNGALKGAAKGIPAKNQNSAFWQNLFIGDQIRVSYNSLGNLKRSIKNGKRELNNCTRAVTDLQKSVSWWADDNGHVKSVKIENNRRVKQ